MKKIPVTHPGEILNDEFLKSMRISQYKIAKDINVSPRRINEIIHGERAISADTALRLGRYFKMPPEFWLKLQAHYDLETAKDKLENRLKLEVKIYKVQPRRSSNKKTKSTKNS